MPWFKIDDKAHSHPKFMRAGNAALGLWLRCGSYSAQHLTEGIVPGVIAQLYGTGPQAAKLCKTGLWHQAGHDCTRCPQPDDGDYVIHDFFEAGRNTTRAQHEANKQAAADRAAKSRASRKAPGSADETKNIHHAIVDESKTNRPRKEPHFSGSAAGQEHLSHRTPADGVTHTHAAAMPVPGTSYGSTAAAAGGLPDPLADLKRGIAAAGIAGIGWDLKDSQWEYTRQAMDRVGIPAMIAFAVNSARLKGVPAGASAWVNGWRSLEAAPENDGVTYLPAAVGALPTPLSRQQQESDDLFGRAMQRAQARMQQESS